MNFSKSNTDFPTIAHRSIYLMAIRQTPLDISLANASATDELLKSCRQYHAFVMNMLSDMYNDPLAFGIKAGEYDEFLSGKKENAMKQKLPAKTKAIRSETGNAVPSYFRLLNRFAQFGEVAADGFAITEADYAAIRKNYDYSFAKKPEGIEKLIPYKVRLDAFAKSGLMVEELADGSAKLTNGVYPEMFLAFSKLAKSGRNEKPFGEHNFMFTDFRQIWDRFIPGYEDVTRVLPDTQKEVLDKVCELARSLKLRESCTTYWKVNYHYKGKHVMCIDTETDWMGERYPRCNNTRIRVNGAHTKSYTDNIAEKGEEFVKYFMQHLNYCTACSTSHSGWQREMFGRTVRLCSEPHFRITNPGMEDLEYIEEFIKLRIEEIHLEKANKV